MGKAVACCAGTMLLVTLALYQATARHRSTMLIEFPSSSTVLPTHMTPYQVEDYPGMTDADQSPQLPEKFVKEEALADKEQKRMMALLERQSKMEDGINQRVSAIGNYVDDEASFGCIPPGYAGLCRQRDCMSRV